MDNESVVQPLDTITPTKSELALQKREKNLESAGVTRQKVYEKLEKGLSAVKVVTEIIDGQVHETEVEDFAIRHKYIETALKVFGDLVEVKTEVNVDASHKSVQVSMAEREELDRLRMEVHKRVVLVDGAGAVGGEVTP